MIFYLFMLLDYLVKFVGEGLVWNPGKNAPRGKGKTIYFLKIGLK